MGNCCHPFGLKNTSKSHQKNVVLLLVGLDNAGKTTTAKNLVGELHDTVVPTVGFSSFSLTHRGYCVVIYDLGGGPQIRGIWHRYYVDVHGIIFVVDASDVSRLEEGRSVLENLLAHEKLAGKPVLLLANKQDCEGALDEVDVVEQLNVEAVVNQHRCPTLVEMCSATAVKKYHRKQDLAIQNGFRWLMNCIIRDYNNLNSRVQNDVAVQRKQEEKDKKERLERIRKAREEREEDVADGVTANGACSAEVDDGSDSDVVEANPFKPLADIMEDMKSPPAVTVEPVLESRVILVKESPKKMQPSNEDKENQLYGTDSNKLTRDLKKFVDIDGDEVELIASAGSRESLRSGAGDRSALGTAVKSSPNHSATEIIKDQLELEITQCKKHHFLHRTNRVVPAPLSPASYRCQHSLDETDLCRVKNHNEKQGKSRPAFLRRQAFTEEIARPQESQISLKKKQLFDISNLFCLHTRSASLEKLENSYSHESLHEINSAGGRSKKRLHTGELKLTNTKVQPVNTETSLPSGCNGADFQPSVESDKATGIKQISNNSFSLQSHDGVQGLGCEISPVPIRTWAIDTEDGETPSHKLSHPEKTVSEEQSCVEHNSKVNSRQTSACEDEVRLKQDVSVDGTTSSDMSQPGSQHLSDSGFVSPKNILPPLRLTSTVDKPPWILPPLSSQTKPSSHDSLLEVNKPQTEATVTESQLSYDSSGEPLK